MRAAVEFLSGVLGGGVLAAGLFAVAVAVAPPPIPETARPAEAPVAELRRRPPEPGGGYRVRRITAPIPAAAYRTSYVPTEAGMRRARMRFRDVSWRYRMIVPRRAYAGQPSPVVILLHGDDAGPEAVLDIWRGLADTAGLILVAPEAGRGGWRLGRDGPGFAHALLADIAQSFPIDPGRIFLFGHDAGAGHALALANAAPALWRAVAVHGGAVPPGLLRRGAGALPDIAIFAGSRDETYPLTAVHASAGALAEAGHAVTLSEITGHTHWPFDIGPWLSGQAWAFFRSR